MKTNFYKIGFFVLLAILIVGGFYVFIITHQFNAHFKGNVKDTTAPATSVNTQQEEYFRLLDSVQRVKDSINSLFLL